jgi:hypothetical protein
VLDGVGVAVIAEGASVLGVEDALIDHVEEAADIKLDAVRRTGR